MWAARARIGSAAVISDHGTTVDHLDDPKGGGVEADLAGREQRRAQDERLAEIDDAHRGRGGVGQRLPRDRPPAGQVEGRQDRYVGPEQRP